MVANISNRILINIKIKEGIILKIEIPEEMIEEFKKLTQISDREEIGKKICEIIEKFLQK